MRDVAILGRDHIKVDSLDKVLGRAKFAADYYMPDMLYGGVFVGYVPQAGEEVVITEDVITAGTAIRESMAILSRLEGVKVAATFIMVDRKERGKGEKLAMEEVEEEFGFPVYSVVDVYDIIEYLEEKPEMAENVARIKAYLAVNGGKA